MRVYRTYHPKAQPFKVKFAGDSLKLVDAGGGYRTVMTDILEELVDTSENSKVKILKASPDIPDGAQETLMLNEKATDEADINQF